MGMCVQVCVYVCVCVCVCVCLLKVNGETLKVERMGVLVKRM